MIEENKNKKKMAHIPIEGCEFTLRMPIKINHYAVLFIFFTQIIKFYAIRNTIER